MTDTNIQVIKECLDAAVKSVNCNEMILNTGQSGFGVWLQGMIASRKESIAQADQQIEKQGKFDEAFRSLRDHARVMQEVGTQIAFGYKCQDLFREMHVAKSELYVAQMPIIFVGGMPSSHINPEERRATIVRTQSACNTATASFERVMKECDMTEGYGRSILALEVFRNIEYENAKVSIETLSSQLNDFGLNQLSQNIVVLQNEILPKGIILADAIATFSNIKNAEMIDIEALISSKAHEQSELVMAEMLLSNLLSQRENITAAVAKKSADELEAISMSEKFQKDEKEHVQYEAENDIGYA